MTRFLQHTYPHHEHVERAGNTKTFGVVRGELSVRADIPSELCHGLFAEPAEYPAWVRFAGPGPLAPSDMHDNAIMSLGVKVMGVPGPKLLPDEGATQDFLGISAPTFTTPDLVQNAILQSEIGNGTPLLYFIRPSHTHLCDLIMQGLYAKTAASPLQVSYWSCVPCLLGPGQAMQYRFVPRPFPQLKVPRRPGPSYLREAMAATLAHGEVNLRPACPDADRPSPHADRERGRGVVDAPLEATLGRDPAAPAADFRLAGTAGLCRRPLVQPVARGAGPSPTRQPEPGAPGDLRRAGCRSAADERRAARRTDR